MNEYILESSIFRNITVNTYREQHVIYRYFVAMFFRCTMVLGDEEGTQTTCPLSPLIDEVVISFGISSKGTFRTLPGCSMPLRLILKPQVLRSSS